MANPVAAKPVRPATAQPLMGETAKPLGIAPEPQLVELTPEKVLQAQPLDGTQEWPATERAKAQPTTPSVDRNLHRQIYIAMCANVDTTLGAIKGSGEVQQQFQHILGLSEVAAFQFNKQ